MSDNTYLAEGLAGGVADECSYKLFLALLQWKASCNFAFDDLVTVPQPIHLIRRHLDPLLQHHIHGQRQLLAIYSCNPCGCSHLTLQFRYQYISVYTSHMFTPTCWVMRLSIAFFVQQQTPCHFASTLHHTSIWSTSNRTVS